MRNIRPTLLLAVAVAVSAPAEAQSTAFTYQGRLLDRGTPADGVYDLEFRLFKVDTGSGEVAKPWFVEDVVVTGGLFTVELDFGAPPFDGDDRWLEIGVRPGASDPADPYTPLTPRQKLTAIPYALFAPTAGTALSFAGGLSGEVAGGITSTVVSNAVAANTSNAIVRRDATGSFSAGSLTLNGNLNLPNTNAAGTVGVLTKGGSPFLQNFGTANTFVGELAGSTTFTGGSNAGVGNLALGVLAGGSSNAAFGSRALENLSTGNGNIAIGSRAGQNLSSGFDNIYIGNPGGASSETNMIRIGSFQESAFFGTFKLRGSEPGGSMLFVSQFSEPLNPVGGFNTAFGSRTLENAGSPGNENTAFGSSALRPLAGGSSNAAFGSRALENLSTGNGNIAIGSRAGQTLSSGFDNIYIGNPGGGSSESSTIRIGSAVHTSTLLQGTVSMPGNASVGGNLSFGATRRQMINLFNATNGIGVQTSTTYFRSDGGFAWFTGGLHNDAANNAGAGGTVRMTLNATGLTVNGTFVSASDREAKQDVVRVDVESILDRVDQLPIDEWSYKADPEARHVGPMAQDFHAAFGLGADDRHIAMVDADGVALAAIQGLRRLATRQARELSEQRLLIRDLAERLAKLEAGERR